MEEMSPARLGDQGKAIGRQRAALREKPPIPGKESPREQHVTAEVSRGGVGLGKAKHFQFHSKGQSLSTCPGGLTPSSSCAEPAPENRGWGSAEVTSPDRPAVGDPDPSKYGLYPLSGRRRPPPAGAQGAAGEAPTAARQPG